MLSSWLRLFLPSVHCKLLKQLAYSSNFSFINFTVLKQKLLLTLHFFIQTVDLLLTLRFIRLRMCQNNVRGSLVVCNAAISACECGQRWQLALRQGLRWCCLDRTGLMMVDAIAMLLHLQVLNWSWSWWSTGRCNKSVRSDCITSTGHGWCSTSRSGIPC